MARASWWKVRPCSHNGISETVSHAFSFWKEGHMKAPLAMAREKAGRIVRLLVWSSAVVLQNVRFMLGQIYLTARAVFSSVRLQWWRSVVEIPRHSPYFCSFSFSGLTAVLTRPARRCSCQKRFPSSYLTCVCARSRIVGRWRWWLTPVRRYFGLRNEWRDWFPLVVLEDLGRKIGDRLQPGRRRDEREAAADNLLR